MPKSTIINYTLSERGEKIIKCKLEAVCEHEPFVELDFRLNTTGALYMDNSVLPFIKQVSVASDRVLIPTVNIDRGALVLADAQFKLKDIPEYAGILSLESLGVIDYVDNAAARQLHILRKSMSSHE